MRLLFTSLLGLAAVLATGAAEAACDGNRALSDSSTKECSRDGMKCAYWEPPTNDPNTKYPLVVWLHGAGASASEKNPDSFVQQVDDGWTCQLQELMDSRTAFPSYVIAPRAPNSATDVMENPNPGAFVTWDWSNPEFYNITTLAESQTLKTARAMIQALQMQYPNIDPERIYVMGVSMGGFGTWDMISRAPDFFAAGVPAEGGGSPQAAPNLKNMAVWSFHDADDPGVPVGSDRAMFAAIAKAGGRPYYTEAVIGGHGGGMYRAAESGFVPWMFAQRRGIPATSAPRLTFSPEGGQLPGPSVTVTLTTTPQSDSIYYTTDGTIPDAITHVGTQYGGPFTLNASAVVIVAAHVNDGVEQTIFHAAPFKVGDSPLPACAELMPYTPYVPPVGGTGGAANSTGGAANGTGGAPSGAVASGGARSATGGTRNAGGAANPFPTVNTGGAASGSGGSKASTSGGAGSVPAATTSSTARSSSGCMLAGAAQPRNSMLSFGVTAVALAGHASRRRKRTSRS